MAKGVQNKANKIDAKINTNSGELWRRRILASLENSPQRQNVKFTATPNSTKRQIRHNANYK